MEKIKILDEKRKIAKTKQLYEAIFEEDTNAFVSYYYLEKTKYNKVYAYYNKNILASMLHLNPYEMQYVSGEKTYNQKANYIVAVATQPEYRRQGYMKQLLTKAIGDMEEEGQPFTFLMPASPEIYTPFQFTYIYDKEQYALYESGISKKFLSTILQEKRTVGVFPKGMETLWVRQAKKEDFPILEEFSKEVMPRNYALYCARNERYFETIQKELKSQNGAIILIEDKATLIGYFFYLPETGFIQEAQVREGYSLTDFMEVKREMQPTIMARILNLKEMGSCIKRKKGLSNVSCYIEIEDKMIEKNNGFFEWKITENGSLFWQREEEKTQNEDAIKVSIEILTSYFFGYQTEEQCFGTLTKEQKHFFEQVQTLKAPYINEMV